MGRIVIVYHEPGDPASVKLVEDLASRLEDRLGVRVVTVQMKDVESRGAKAFNSGDTVVSLLPARGGHLHTVAEAAKRAGAKHVGPIPPSLTARALIPVLKGCREVGIVYWPAKRFKAEQREDLEEVASRLEEGTGARVELVSIGDIRCLECMASSSLLPGRASRAVESCNPARKVPYLLAAARHLIEEWIEGLATLEKPAEG